MKDGVIEIAVIQQTGEMFLIFQDKKVTPEDMECMKRTHELLLHKYTRPLWEVARVYETSEPQWMCGYCGQKFQCDENEIVNHLRAHGAVGVRKIGKKIHAHIPQGYEKKLFK